MGDFKDSKKTKKLQAEVRRIFTLLISLFTIAGLKAIKLHCSFTPSALFGCPPLVINFTDNSTGNPHKHYCWDFDNGVTSIAQNPVASYPLPGIYNVVHVVYNGNQSDSEIIQIRVYQPPIDSFTSFDNQGCNNPCHMVNFQDMTVPGESPIVQYVWDFGDGSQPTQG